MQAKPWDVVTLKGHTSEYRAYSRPGGLLFVCLHADVFWTDEQAEVESIVASTGPEQVAHVLPEDLAGAYDALRNGQGQADMDGCLVTVSRQALEEILDFFDAPSEATPQSAEGGE